MTLRYPSEVGSGDYITLIPHEYRSNASGANGPPVGPAIMLYMPNSTPPMRNEQVWQAERFDGPMGAFVKGLSSTVVNAAHGDGGRAIDSFKRSFTPGNFPGGGLAQQAVTNVVAAASGRQANQILSYSRGEIFNPNIELLYDGPSVRSFDLNFNFIPKDPTEAYIVTQIIFQLKAWSSPEEQGQKYKIPAVWSITYGGAGGTWMNKFKRSAMTGIGVQYNAGLDMHATFSNGCPVRTDIQLTFTEVDVITRKDHMSNVMGGGY